MMPLSEYEERVIAAMEQQMTEPAEAVTDRDSSDDASTFVKFGAISLVVGLSVLILTFRISELLAALGFIGFFLGSVAVYEGVQAGGTFRPFRRH
jgi:Protein of unknown function (DUF3040)